VNIAATSPVVPLPRFLSLLSHFDGLNVRISQTRASNDTRRSIPAYLLK